MGFTRGGTLPAGLQFFGRPWSEATLLRSPTPTSRRTHHRRATSATAAAVADDIEDVVALGTVSLEKDPDRQPRRDRRARSSARAARWACRRSPSTPSAIATALHVRYADEALRDRSERAARELPAHRPHDRRGASNPGADAVHPGYGFLAENEEFAAAVRDAGLTFIGPTPEAIATDGQQDRGADGGDARRRAGRARHRGSAGAPTCPTRTSPTVAAAIGYPLLVKAVAGGGGKGMRTVDRRRPISPARCAPRARKRRRVRRRRGLPRAAADAAAPHRSAAARRRARHGAAVRRARVLDPAPPPEGRRGDAVAGGVAGAARGDDRRRPRRSRGPSATPTPARSSSCSTRTAASISSR